MTSIKFPWCFPGGLALCFLLCFLSCRPGEQNNVSANRPGADTIQVAVPTGEMAKDRTSILQALEDVTPGGVVLFAPGTYKIGPMIPVSTSGITLLGHPEGTIIRGCDPENFTDMEQAFFNCHGIELRGARQTVRNLTLEYAWHGIYVGCCWPENMEQLQQGHSPAMKQPGGHLIEGNTFRYVPNGLRLIGKTDEPVVIQDNRFIDVYHAIGINGGVVEFRNNTITIEHPERVPISYHPGDAINILPFSSLLDMNQTALAEDYNSCRGNVIEGNTIEGYPDGICNLVVNPNSGCQENIIRNNTIRLARAKVVADWEGIQWSDWQDSTVVGIPLRLNNLLDPDSANTFIRNNQITQNRILGADGVAVEVINASGNSIRENVFSDIQRREPFPGNILGDQPDWEAANGSAIWLSPGSNRNEIIQNHYEQIDQYLLFIEGDSNLIQLENAEENVMDKGRANSIKVK